MESGIIKKVSSSESLEAAGPWLHSDLGMLPLRSSREPVLTEVILFMTLCYGSPGKSTPPPSNCLQAWLKIRKVLKTVQAGGNAPMRTCRDVTVGCGCGQTAGLNRLASFAQYVWSLPPNHSAGRQVRMHLQPLSQFPVS